jgi:hypothetical protein
MKQDITITMKSAILLAAASCIVLGVYPQLAASILPYQSKLAVYSKDGVLTALKFLGMGLVTFVVLKGVLEKGIKPPVWLSAEYLIYQPLLARLMLMFTFTGWVTETMVEGSIVGSTGPLSYMTRSVRLVERKALPWVGESLLQWGRIMRDKTYDFVVKRVDSAKYYVHNIQVRAFTTMIKLDYNPRGEQLYRKLTLMNLDVCIFIIVIMLVIVLLVRLVNMLGL